MKKKSSKMVWLAIVFAAFGFVNCGGSEDENGGLEIPPTTTSKHIVRVNEVTKTNDNQIVSSDTYDYIYDNQGRVAQIQKNGRTRRSYSYGNNIIKETINEDRFSWDNIYTIENGVIVKIYDGDSNTTNEFSYKNGYLITDISPKLQIQYEWKDGNLVSIVHASLLETFEYTNYSCPQGFFPFVQNAHIGEKWGMSTYLGKTMKNLPSKHTEDNFVETYEWTIKEGLPINLIRKEENYAYYITFEWEN